MDVGGVSDTVVGESLLEFVELIVALSNPLLLSSRA